MKVELLTLCEYAANNGGKLTIVDTIDEILVDKFPWRAYFGIAMKIDMTDSPDKGTLSLAIHEANSTKNLFMSECHFESEGTTKIVAAGNVKGLIFQEAGTYIFSLSSEAEILGTISFLVRERSEKDENNDG